jgi:hypothetical protein
VRVHDGLLNIPQLLQLASRVTGYSPRRSRIRILFLALAQCISPLAQSFNKRQVPCRRLGYRILGCRIGSPRPPGRHHISRLPAARHPGSTIHGQPVAFVSLGQLDPPTLEIDSYHANPVFQFPDTQKI